MLNKVLAIIPARAGSKGVPGKNKRNFCGAPLINWSIRAAEESESVSEILVTTDDLDIITSLSNSNRVDYLIERPAIIASDDSPATEYIHHALNLVSAKERFEYFCILQPTSPLRMASDIDALFGNVVRFNMNAGVTVVNVPHNFSPDSLMVKKGDFVSPTNTTKDGANLRQEKKLYYARNGAAVYICRVDYFLDKGSLFDDQMSFFEMPLLRSIDIDTEEEFKLAELVMKERI